MEAPSSRPCARCKTNPQDRKKSSYCHDCRNANAAEYRLKARPRPVTEERVCSLSGCDQVYIWSSTHAKAMYCSKSHYNKHRYWANRPLDEVVPDGQKRCSKCKESKGLADFPPSVRHRSGGNCRACAREYEAAWNAANRERNSAASRRSRAKRLLQRYGAYSDNIDQIVQDQGGVCYLCSDLPSSIRGFHIDHDHESETVGLPSYRGLACHGCNVGIGALGDDPQRIRRVADRLAAAKAALRGVQSLD